MSEIRLKPTNQVTQSNSQASQEYRRTFDEKNLSDSGSLNGEPVQTLPSHSYRHSLAMRYLANGYTFENIAMVLGDEIGTLEKHYAELFPNDAQRLAFEKAFRKSAWISSEGTAQPE